jgi:hypothetical protein
MMTTPHHHRHWGWGGDPPHEQLFTAVSSSQVRWAREQQWHPLHLATKKRIHPTSSCSQAWVSSHRVKRKRKEKKRKRITYGPRDINVSWASLSSAIVTSFTPSPCRVHPWPLLLLLPSLLVSLPLFPLALVLFLSFPPFWRRLERAWGFGVAVLVVGVVWSSLWSLWRQPRWWWWVLGIGVALAWLFPDAAAPPVVGTPPVAASSLAIIFVVLVVSFQCFLVLSHHFHCP